VKRCGFANKARSIAEAATGRSALGKRTSLSRMEHAMYPTCFSAYLHA